MAKQTIDLDCAPMTPRPDSYIAGVLKDTGIEVREPSSKLMGNWTWNFEDVSEETWEKAKPLFKKRIEKLYEEGKIRYGSW